MTSETIIEFSINIAPWELNNKYSIEENIMKKIKANKSNFNSQKNGCIIDINKVKILSNTISNLNCNIIYNLKLFLSSINPAKGKGIRNCIVKAVPRTGIICVFHTMNIWIPLVHLENYKFVNGVFLNEKDNKSIMKGTMIDIIIDMVRYEDKVFSCIAKLDEN